MRNKFGIARTDVKIGNAVDTIYEESGVVRATRSDINGLYYFRVDYLDRTAWEELSSIKRVKTVEDLYEEYEKKAKDACEKARIALIGFIFYSALVILWIAVLAIMIIIAIKNI